MEIELAKFSSVLRFKNSALQIDRNCPKIVITPTSKVPILYHLFVWKAVMVDITNYVRYFVL